MCVMKGSDYSTGKVRENENRNIYLCIFQLIFQIWTWVRVGVWIIFWGGFKFALDLSQIDEKN